MSYSDQGPGDFIFIPGSWWHSSVCLTETFAYIRNYINVHTYRRAVLLVLVVVWVLAQMVVVIVVVSVVIGVLSVARWWWLC